jgi:hypothetical protein
MHAVTERRSYKNELPGSRSGPCLGCGGRVVTARDPHVMMAGKRDGSVLAMFDAAPLLMLASDPNQLSQPGLELLGVAHRVCADRARQRLEAREVELPDDLPQLVADEEAGELPELHRPPAPGRCAFCLETDLTDEHIWPRWMSQLLGSNGFTISSPHGPRRRRSIDLTARVCRTYNNRWLAVLEHDVKPLLSSLIQGREQALLPSAQRLLATWAVKTALMLDLSGDQPLIPAGFYHNFRLQRSPLPSHIVWIGAYRDSTRGAWARHYDLHLGISAGEPPNAFSTTFTAFRVVLQVFVYIAPGRAHLDDRRLVAAALDRSGHRLGGQSTGHDEALPSGMTHFRS